MVCHHELTDHFSDNFLQHSTSWSRLQLQWYLTHLKEEAVIVQNNAPALTQLDWVMGMTKVLLLVQVSAAQDWPVNKHFIPQKGKLKVYVLRRLCWIIRDVCRSGFLYYGMQRSDWRSGDDRSDTIMTHQPPGLSHCHSWYWPQLPCCLGTAARRKAAF